MTVNIAIAVVLAILTASVSGLAGQIAATKTWHKWFFWLTGGAMILLIGIQTYRTESSQEHLDKQIDAIQQNTAVPAQVRVTLPAIPQQPAPKSKGFLQFDRVEFREDHLAPGDPFSVNIYLINKGTEQIYNVHTYFSTDIENSAGITTRGLSAALDKKEHAKFVKELRHNDDYKNLAKPQLGVGETVWSTVGLQSLTSDQISGLANGNSRFYFFAYGRWDNSEKDLDICRWLQAPESTQVKQWNAVWHYCD